MMYSTLKKKCINIISCNPHKGVSQLLMMVRCKNFMSCNLNLVNTVTRAS